MLLGGCLGARNLSSGWHAANHRQKADLSLARTHAPPRLIHMPATESTLIDKQREWQKGGLQNTAPKNEVTVPQHSAAAAAAAAAIKDEVLQREKANKAGRRSDLETQLGAAPVAALVVPSANEREGRCRYGQICKEDSAKTGTFTCLPDRVARAQPDPLRDRPVLLLLHRQRSLRAESLERRHLNRQKE